MKINLKIFRESIFIIIPIKYLFRIIISYSVIITITACSNSRDTVLKRYPENIYTNSQKKIQQGNYKEAIKLLETFYNCYPLSPYAQQAQLNMIYACYKSNNLQLAITTIDRFIRLNPTHPNIDYVLYIRGLTMEKLNNNSILQKFFNIDYSNCDPQYTIMAFKDFSKLIQLYPNSIYATDASKHLAFLKEQLAKHELTIIKYYNKHAAYIAVINRTEQMLKNYPDTKSIRKALKYMEMAYDKLGLTIEKNKVAKLIAANPI